MQFFPRNLSVSFTTEESAFAALRELPQCNVTSNHHGHERNLQTITRLMLCQHSIRWKALVIKIISVNSAQYRYYSYIIYDPPYVLGLCTC